MVNHHGCINGTLQGSDHYSAPVPVIGLYIAAASAVCAILMLYDIVFYGLNQKQRWLPCKWFKLNSVTLSLIGVVVKLTVDLTTSMPNALDQLSKLAGTTSLCIYMCYVFPSIPDMKDSTNMFALIILVVTVFVNMCIQLSTGVIALFFPEHIALICIMLALLWILWRIFFLARNERRDSVATGKSEFLMGKYAHLVGVKPESFLKRLKGCYLSNYEVNPQFIECRRVECGAIGDLSLISLAILIQAALRSIVLKKENLCTGKSSDYQWSMGMIVVTQFVFIIIGSFASCFRRWTMLPHLDLHLHDRKLIEEPYCSNRILKSKLSLLLIKVDNVYIMIITMHSLLVSFSVTFCTWVLSSMRKAVRRVFIMLKCYTSDEEEWISSSGRFKGFRDSFTYLTFYIREWTRQKGESNMENFIQRSIRKSNGLCNLLSSIIPADSVIGRFDVAVHPTMYQESTEEIQLPPARLHPLVVLVRLLEVVMPESASQNKIVKMFREAFETLHFIEKHMHNTTLKDIKETEIAKAVWAAGDFRRLLPANLRSSEQFPSREYRAFRVMNYICEKMKGETNDSVLANVRHIKNFLSKWSYSTVGMDIIMQELFVYMLNVMLAQLPDAIFKAVSQSPDDEFEDRVRESLKHLSMLQSWDGIYKWKPPQGLENCAGLLDPEKPDAPSVDIQNPAPVYEDEEEDLGDTSIPSPRYPALNEGNEIFSVEEHHVTITEDDEEF